MYLRSIQIENFRRYKSIYTDFPEGVTGIIGNNGAGKSTLVEAVAWAIYGNEASRTSKEQIKTLGAKPSEACRVILEFDLNGDYYRVVRELKGVSNSVDASVIVNQKPLVRGSEPCRAYLEKLLGMDYKAFITSFFAKQKELNALSDILPSKRKELLAKMLGVEHIDEALKNLRQDKRDLEARIEISRTLVKDQNLLLQEKKQKENLKEEIGERKKQKENELILFSEQLSQLEESYQKEKIQYQTFQKLTKENEVLETKVNNFSQQAVELEKEIRNLQSLFPKIEKMKPELKGLEKVKKEVTEIEKMKIKLNQKELNEKQLKDLGDYLVQDQKQIDQLAEFLRQEENVQAELSLLKNKLFTNENELEKTRKDYVGLQAEFKTKQTEKEKLLEQMVAIEKLGPDSVCDRCLRPLGADYENIQKHFQEELSFLEQNLTQLNQSKGEVKKLGEELKKEKETLEKEKERKQKELEKLSQKKGEKESLEKGIKEKKGNIEQIQKFLQELGKVKHSESEHRTKKQVLENLEKINIQFIQLNQEISRLPQLEKNLFEAKESLSSVHKQQEQVLENLEELDFSFEKFQQRENQLNSLKEQKHQSELLSQEISHQLELTAKEIEQKKQEIEQSQKITSQIKESEKEKLYWEKLDELFSDFRISLIGRIRPALSSFAQELFVELSDGRYSGFELDEDYEIYIYDQGEKFPLERFSGGEKDLANLCLRLAISLLISQSSGLGFSFIILDEIFGSQDSSRQQNILNALAHLKNRFNQIILITHVEEIKDSVENVITVKENEDGTSQLLLS